MVKTLDFYPPQTTRIVDDVNVEPGLDMDFGTSFLMTDIPLRYIFQYALNHLRGHPQTFKQGGPYQSSVFIVARSRTELQTRMDHEQRKSQPRLREPSGPRQEKPSSATTTTATEKKDIWRHLFPPQSTTMTGSTSLEDTSTTEADSFEPELWSRIQMRYAPTLDHVQSLFRGLHLGPEETNGVTLFGPDSAQSSTSTRRCFPSLVILVDCFSMDNNTGTAAFSTASSSSSTTTTVNEDRGQDSQNLPHALIAAASKTLSEIKDSLDWIKQTSGQNVDLAIFEDTTRAVPSATSARNYEYDGDGATTKFPSPRELWLQRTIGYWVDAIINVQRTKPNTITSTTSSRGEQKEKKSLELDDDVGDRDSFTMWIKTRESLQRLVDTSLANPSSSAIGGGAISEQLLTDDSGSLSPMSVGALATVEWSFNHEKNIFKFTVAT
ncbi:hypothetical protein BGZ83_000088 [Gryganskiella cystojenkinii]|nr:hypothetical protein BGZ83_000088 [Gryganskiella cystojenkinii]